MRPVNEDNSVPSSLYNLKRLDVSPGDDDFMLVILRNPGEMSVFQIAWHHENKSKEDEVKLNKKLIEQKPNAAVHKYILEDNEAKEQSQLESKASKLGKRSK